MCHIGAPGKQRPALIGRFEFERLHYLLALCPQVLHSVGRRKIGSNMGGEVLIKVPAEVGGPLLALAERRLSLAFFGVLEEQRGVKPKRRKAI